MTSFADGYTVRGSPADDQRTWIGFVPTFVIYDVTKPLHISGLVVMTVDATQSALVLEAVDDDSGHALGDPTTYDVSALVADTGASPFPFDFVASPGRLGQFAIQLFATATDATGPTVVSVAAVHCRYD